ncbi:DNA internalization-related competence protein ComEC/Rec2 [Magnetococcus sp. PR-3]|uniref:DNA internalization-related competence protein ComEC/Rec2 n=1 Tax=Magnetococcus sp. PR-3 TaxID=3120355 RepID=UPI002FCDEFD3
MINPIKAVGNTLLSYVPRESTSISRGVVFLFSMVIGIFLASKEALLPSVVLLISLIIGRLWLSKASKMMWFMVVLGVLVGFFNMHQRGYPETKTWPERWRHGVEVEGVITHRSQRGRAARLQLSQVVIENKSQPGSVWVNLYKQQTAAMPGDRVRLVAKMRPAQGFRVPGGFDYGLWLRRQGVELTGYSNRPVTILDQGHGYRWNAFRYQISLWIDEQLAPKVAPLAQALLIGQRDAMDLSLKEQWQVAGIYHLVAISGLHVGLVAAGLFQLWRWLLSRRLRWVARWDIKPMAALLSLPGVVAYGYLAGWGISSQRAVIMAVVLLLALGSGRWHQPWRALLVAALVILLWAPWDLFSAGFQLSFLCVVVLLGMFVPPGPELAPVLARTLLPPEPQDQSAMQRWLHSLLTTVKASVLLGVVTGPVVSALFHRIALYGVGLNLMAIPWVSFLVVPAGLLAVLFYPLWPTVALGFLKLTGLLLWPVQWLVEQVQSAPAAWWRSVGMDREVLWVYLIIMVLAFMVVGWRRRAPLLMVGMLLVFWPRGSASVARMEVNVLEVGQAQSVLVRDGAGEWSVLDAGGVISTHFHVGEQVLSGFLWDRGVTELKRVVVSHAQRDHMAGAARLVQNFRVHELWLPRRPEAEPVRWDLQQLLDQAAQRGVNIRYLARGYETQSGGVTWRVGHPDAQQLGDDANDGSLVVEIAYQGQRLLFPGDIEKQGEKTLVEAGWLNNVDWSMGPHHGSRTSSSPEFIQAIDAEQVIFSVGLGNHWGFPKPDVVARWQQAGAEIFRTDQSGSLRFCVDSAGIEKLDWQQGTLPHCL